MARVGTLSLTSAGAGLTFNGTAANPNTMYFDLGNGGNGTDQIVAAGPSRRPMPTACWCI